MNTYSRQQLKAELRAHIWNALRARRDLNHSQRKTLAKTLFWQIWKQTSDKESLRQGIGWAFFKI